MARGVWACTGALLLAGAVTSGQGRVARAASYEPVPCAGPVWRAVRAELDRYCREHRAGPCQARCNLGRCRRGERPLLLSRGGGYRLRIEPDCWYWLARVAPPEGYAEPARAWRRERLDALLAAGWRITRLEIGDRCD